MSVDPYTLSKFSRFFTPSINQSLRGATDNKIFLPIVSFFFFKKGIIFLSETFGASVDSIMMIGGFLVFRLIFAILVNTFNSGL